MLTKFDAFVGKIFVLVALLVIRSYKKELQRKENKRKERQEVKKSKAAKAVSHPN